MAVPVGRLPLNTSIEYRMLVPLSLMMGKFVVVPWYAVSSDSEAPDCDSCSELT
jgi:hypothetical protein